MHKWPFRPRLWIAGVTAGLAAFAALTPMQPMAVERVFSVGIYPAIQHALTRATNLLPVPLFDLLIAVLLVVVPTTTLLAVHRARRGRTWRPVVDWVIAIVISASTLYLLFLGLWGLNYRRLPMDTRLQLDRPAPRAEDVARLAMVAVRQLNALHAEAHNEGWNANEWRDDHLRPAFAEVQAMLTDAPLAVPGRLKDTLFGAYFRWTTVDGMVNPFGLEVIANPDLLPFERPFVAAHEWAHLAGYAHEDEANFVGWLTCLRASPAAQYSGWLYLYWQASGEVDDAERARLRAALTRGPQRDIDSIIERLRRGQLTLLRNASWVMYDQYLKANRVDEGVRSYGEVITLILRARFDAGWVPVRRVQ
jgi:hypothetical protein